MTKERVRFAPSPTGRLHIGNARTALFNWLFAAQNEGSFILRIEDTDEQRSTRSYERQVVESLRWLGLEWDEGPDRAGRHGPYRQSERLDLYARHARELIDKGKAYPCYCTDEELEKGKQAMLSAGIAPKYPGTCRNLSAEQRRALEEQGRVPCIRYRTPDSGIIRVHDKIHGLVTFRMEDIGDFVLVRSNGMPAYNFAVVIDDHYMEITMVIRGEDHLANTPRQSLLFREFGWTMPSYAHHGLLMGADGSKLSKRHGAVTVEAFRKMGILPEALINYFALLGGNLVDGREIFDPSELVDSFSLRKAGKSGAIFDQQKLLWVNQQHLRDKPAEVLAGLFAPFLEKGGYSFTGKTKEWTDEVCSIIAENVRSLEEASAYGPIFFDALPVYGPDVCKQLTATEFQNVLLACRKRFQLNPSNDKKEFSAMTAEVRAELQKSGREVFLPLRMAITGMESGPELDRILPLLRTDTVLERLNAAIGFAEGQGGDREAEKEISG